MELLEAKKLVEEACDGQWQKKSFSPCEQLALTVLSPYLELIGARVMQILDVAAQRAVEKTKERLK